MRHLPGNRILLVRPDRVGDVIISTSCLDAVRRNKTGTRLYFLAREPMRPLLEGHPLLDGFISDPDEMAKLHLDAVVHLHPDKDCCVAAHRARIPVRIGYRQRFLTRYLTASLPDQRGEGHKHEAACNFDLLRLLGVAQPTVLTASVHLPPAARESLRAKLPWPLERTRFAVINPTAHSHVARWPAERFARIAGWLRHSLGFEVVVISAEHVPAWSGALVDLSGRTDLGELGWLLKHARVLVTRDTGPSHLAAAVGCPTVVIFGRTTPLHGPVRWRPLAGNAVVVAQPLRRKFYETHHRHWKRGFDAISVEMVQHAVRQAIG